ncbi:MAG: Thioredoxin [Candidatus Woesebacteria bacterium GW2011_GWB1_38_5]|uniref:Thioredoxin n=4 Tax=Candidatus Woeseibacteriota TaxID=1752722 RepID=A0A0G0KIE1_9BACT|nr:MAG: Thioredoxin [Candidatus Woesebacteria bacterium GW2011_GWD1_38_10]KKQ54763.1 MAG: Thioredoxin [Candidatus Woesebacteria bacterium GW2011_GWC1_38_13]KKQ75280.1 MAG: Thioredoxin [Candidatus Woesebacteria bacterium GW2011_GWB1_38_5]KKQ81869.1 MAG: Thioredoxin [Candidatus Woesebacteria bacterium GW2011_GWA1_38_8]
MILSGDLVVDEFSHSGYILIRNNMATILVTDSDFQEKIVSSSLPVLVDFYADWCGPCKMAGPILEELSEDYKDKLIVAKVNVDQNQNSAQQYDVMSIPTVILVKDGKEVGRQIGFAGKLGYEELIKKVL